MKLSEIKDLYLLSPAYLQTKPVTKKAIEQGFGYIDEFMKKDADKITRPMVIDFRDRNYDKIGKCRNGLKVLAMLLGFGYDRGYCQGNPARAIRRKPPYSGHEMWTMEEVNKVMATASRPVRDAIILAVYTGQRRGDLTRMRWDNYDGKYIHVIQQKTGKPLAIPVHPFLKSELERMMNERKTECRNILVNVTGWQWSDAYLGATVIKAAKAAGVRKPLHGLRKTTASVLAESGCTPFEICAITGHSLAEVERYTVKANQKVLAQRAIDRWTSS